MARYYYIEVRHMSDKDTRDFANKTFRTMWMVGVGGATYALAQVGVVPGSAAQMIVGGVAYAVVKYGTWAYPRFVGSAVDSPCDCGGGPRPKFGRKRCPYCE